MALFLLTVASLAFIMLIMSVGVIFSGRCLRGSCGGAAVLDSAGEPITCATCPNRDKLRAEAALRTSPLEILSEESPG